MPRYVAGSKRKARELAVLRTYGSRCHYCGIPLVFFVGTREPRFFFIYDEHVRDYVPCNPAYLVGAAQPNDPQQGYFDHIVPRSKGGATTTDNLIPACLSCNSRKGARAYDEFVAQVRAASNGGH